MKANGTIAKDIAIYFFEATDTRYTSSMIAKTIIQAKHLLESDYTSEEIKDAIDYVVNETNITMYSLGYISTMINRILENVEEDRKKEEQKLAIEQSKLEYESLKQKVVENDKSETNNREKLNRFGLKAKSKFQDLFD